MISLPLIALIEKLLTLAVGLGFGWVGYRLLHAGLYEHAPQVRESSADGDVLWKQVLPGLTFALFAGVIVVGSLFQPTVAQTLTSQPAGEMPPPSPEALPEESLLLEGDIDIELLPTKPMYTPGIIPEAGSILHIPETGSVVVE